MSIAFQQLKKRIRKVKEFYDDVGKQFGRTQAEVNNHLWQTCLMYYMPTMQNF